MTPKWSPKSPNCSPTWSPKMMPMWLYRQDFAKLSLNRHYNRPSGQLVAYCTLTPQVLRQVLSSGWARSTQPFIPSVGR
ncbi:hypothetical protein TNCV_4462261 [Trichonephila clavipes]|nr:hypothetical protein TNCV_4462261 [Trichonephila clavipes]